MLGRFLQPLPLGTARRTYSIFSSKPGGGRYFNSAKPHKVTPATTTTTTTTTASSTKSKPRPDDTQPSPSPSAQQQDDPPSTALDREDATIAAPPPARPSAFLSAPPPATAPPLPPHPTFSSHTYPLHQFFAAHRPLLLLPLPLANLFDPPAASLEEATATAPSGPAMRAAPPPSAEHTESAPDADADADAARQLARALAMNHVGGWIDWSETLARLGDVESIGALQRSVPLFGVGMDSTKRKRRKKMSKHKYKKRRRLQRSERRKMGK